MSLDVFWCEKSVAAKGIDAPFILTLLSLDIGADTWFWKRHQAAKPKWGRKHMLHAFCNKCVHISSKPNFEEAYLSEY